MSLAHSSLFPDDVGEAPEATVALRDKKLFFSSMDSFTRTLCISTSSSVEVKMYLVVTLWKN